MSEFSDIAPAAAERIAREIFGVEGEAKELVSYCDRNFRLETETGERFVLKITHPEQPRIAIEAQNEAMRRAAVALLPVPRALPSLDGASIVPLDEILDGQGLVRLLTWLPGRFLVEVSPHPREVLRDFGSFLGRLDLVLASVDHPGARRDHDWDLAHTSWVREELDALEQGWRRERARGVLDRFEEVVLPALPALRRGVIHGDANEHNVLVEVGEGRPGRVSGIIDFGDLVETAFIMELAIACAYAMLDEPEPVASALEIARGYQSVSPLSEAEARLLPLLIESRLVMSVTKGAAALRRHPENAYLGVSGAAAWELLERLEPLDSERLQAAFVGALDET